MFAKRKKNLMIDWLPTLSSCRYNARVYCDPRLLDYWEVELKFIQLLSAVQCRLGVSEHMTAIL